MLLLILLLCYVCLQIWDKYISAIGGGDSLNLENFTNAMRKLVGDPAAEETLIGPMPLFFEAVDANNDGFIDAGEFGIFFKIFGLDEKLGPESFKAIDTNNDGLLSKEEFIAASKEFFTSKDEALPTKVFWGALV